MTGVGVGDRLGCVVVPSAGAPVVVAMRVCTVEDLVSRFDTLGDRAWRVSRFDTLSQATLLIK